MEERFTDKYFKVTNIEMKGSNGEIIAGENGFDLNPCITGFDLKSCMEDFENLTYNYEKEKAKRDIVSLIVPVCLKNSETGESVAPKSIWIRGLANNPLVRGLILPKSVEFILDKGCENCINLVEISGPGLKIIGDRTFNGCINLERIFAPNIQKVGENLFGTTTKHNFRIVKGRSKLPFYLISSKGYNL